MSEFYWHEDDANKVMEMIGFHIGLERGDHLDIHAVAEHLAEFDKCDQGLQELKKSYTVLIARAEAAEKERDRLLEGLSVVYCGISDAESRKSDGMGGAVSIMRHVMCVAGDYIKGKTVRDSVTSGEDIATESMRRVESFCVEALNGCENAS